MFWGQIRSGNLGFQGEFVSFLLYFFFSCNLKLLFSDSGPGPFDEPQKVKDADHLHISSLVCGPKQTAFIVHRSVIFSLLFLFSFIFSFIFSLQSEDSGKKKKKKKKDGEEEEEDTGKGDIWLAGRNPVTQKESHRFVKFEWKKSIASYSKVDFSLKQVSFSFFLPFFPCLLRVVNSNLNPL